MALPDLQDLMLPVLRAFLDGNEHATRDVRTHVTEVLGLTEAEASERVPSGRQTRMANRVAWAHVYLKQAGLLESPRRGVYRITERGRAVLAAPPDRITTKFLLQFAEFQAFKDKEQADESSEGSGAANIAGSDAPELTPDEQVRVGHRRQRAALSAQLLERVKEVSPAFFESIVVQTLVAMGYGGTEEDAARVVGRSGDGGIDGIIKEDRLGLESIYLQAKRYTSGTVGRPEIQQFAGALQGQRARKGVFITTSTFTRDAVEYARGLQNTIVLVDGPQLAELMIDYGIGVSEVQTIRLMKLDEDWFGEE